MLGAAVVTSVAGNVSVPESGLVSAGKVLATEISGNVIGTVEVGVSSSSPLKAPPTQAIRITATIAATATTTQRTTLRLTALERASRSSSACRWARLAFWRWRF